MKTEARDIKYQEKEYKTPFFKFAKAITNGTLGKDLISPTFSRDSANSFYKTTYSTPVTVKESDLTWFPEVATHTVPYDLTPYTAGMIKEALNKNCGTSAPGDDTILYDYLKHMPGTHALLAELFTSIWDTAEAPDSWASSKITLIPKTDEDPSDPTHFRMISLTSNVGKLYHTLESSRTISYMIMNKYLDPSAQKAYIQGINGCIEHVQVIKEVIQHAKANHKSVYITWID